MRIIIFFTALLVFALAGVRAQVSSSAGLKLVATGPVKLVFHNAAFHHDGEFGAGISTVVFAGGAPALRITGSQPVTFHHLHIDLLSGNVLLENDLRINGTLNMRSGNLELNNHVVDLGYTGSILGERNTSRITGAQGGFVRATAILNAPVSANPGNIGVEISSNATLGETVITRGHRQQFSESAQQSIARYYEISPTFNTNLKASVRFYYLDAELQGSDEQQLAIFRQQHAGGKWASGGKDIGNTQLNWVQKNELSELRRFTLARDLNEKLAASGNPFSVQLFPNPTPGTFTVLLGSAVEKETAFVLYDQQGRLLESKKVWCRIGTNTFRWDISRLPAGTYYLSFEKAGGKPVPIVKQ